jgi:hypothetical protein
MASGVDRLEQDVHGDRTAARHCASGATEETETVADRNRDVLRLNRQDRAGVGEVEMLE